MLKANDGTLLLYDLLSLNEVFGMGNIETVLLDPDGTRTIVDSLAQEGAFAYSIETPCSLRIRLTLPHNWCLLGYIHHTDESSWCHGLSLATDTAFTALPEGHSEFMFSAGSRFTLLMMPLQWLHDKFSEMDSRSAAPSRLHTIYRLADPAAAQRLRTLYEEVRRQITNASPTWEVPRPATRAVIDTDALLEGHLAASLSVTADELPNYRSRARRRRYVAVQRTEQFIRANLRNDIYINEMCDAAEVSERTLRYAFDDLLGISPNRYLSMLRLCTACKSLAASDASRRSVKSVALSCGLWDLSRFANSYRRAFGELPHTTLMRNPIGEPLLMY